MSVIRRDVWRAFLRGEAFGRSIPSRTPSGAGKMEAAGIEPASDAPPKVPLSRGDRFECAENTLLWCRWPNCDCDSKGTESASAPDRLALLERAIPIVTDGRFDADSAIEHLENYEAQEAA